MHDDYPTSVRHRFVLLNPKNTGVKHYRVSAPGWLTARSTLRDSEPDDVACGVSSPDDKHYGQSLRIKAQSLTEDAGYGADNDLFDLTLQHTVRPFRPQAHMDTIEMTPPKRRILMVVATRPCDCMLY